MHAGKKWHVNYVERLSKMKALDIQKMFVIMLIQISSSNTNPLYQKAEVWFFIKRREQALYNSIAAEQMTTLL